MIKEIRSYRQPSTTNPASRLDAEEEEVVEYIEDIVEEVEYGPSPQSEPDD